MKRVWHSDFIGFIGIGIMVNLGLGFLSPPFSSSVTVGVRFFVTNRKLLLFSTSIAFFIFLKLSMSFLFSQILLID
uniref:Uncharacterized protein n=1 Tax=Anguilla anguilla TaxID=7936 RepID=A0A0E9U739_ANGAN